MTKVICRTCDTELGEFQRVTSLEQAGKTVEDAVEFYLDYLNTRRTLHMRAAHRVHDTCLARIIEYEDDPS